MILTIVLAVVAIVLFVHMVFDGSTPATASASVASTSQSGTAPAAQSRLAAHKAAVKSRVNSSLDPSVRMEVLRASENVVYRGTGHNIFRAESDPQPPQRPVTCAPLGEPSRGLPWCKSIGPNPPMPPPPIDLKFFGFANKAGEPKKVFLSQGDNIFIASEGDIVDRRYKVVHIEATSVEIEDVLNNYKQPIKLQT
ncbi:MAG TPA: hypothetical protein VFA71_06825 [Terriglobales bacterium]|nr:hypothetical protein [Terriglobales bacterium]